MKLSLLSLALTPSILAAPIDTSATPANSSGHFNSSSGPILSNSTKHDLEEIKKVVTLKLMANFTENLLASLNKSVQADYFSSEDKVTFLSRSSPLWNQKRGEKSFLQIFLDGCSYAIKSAAKTLANGLEFITPEEIAEATEAVEGIL